LTLQALAAGTLLYVSVFEVLGREKARKNAPGLLQLFCAIAGFCALMTVDLVAPHDHSHEDGHSHGGSGDDDDDHDHDEGEDEHDHDHEDHLLAAKYRLLESAFQQVANNAYQSYQQLVN